MFPIINPQPQFNVLNLPGLFAWYHANNVYGNNTNPSSGTAINKWSDLSPNSYDFTQSTGANQPIFTTNLQNGNPGIVFTTPYELLGQNAFFSNITTIYTIYMVMISTNQAPGALPLIANPDDLSNRFNFIVPNYSNTSVYIDFGNVFTPNRLIVSESDIYAGTYAHCFQLNSPSLTIFRNNVQLGTNNLAGTFTYGSKVPDMGFQVSTGYTMFEMICCNEVHNAEIMTQVFSYLNNYWGL